MYLTKVSPLLSKARWLVDLSLLNLQIRRVRQQSRGLSQVIPPALINPISPETQIVNHN